MSENQLEGEIYGALLLSVSDAESFSPLEFPFSELKVQRGNHLKPYESTTVNSFDFWHGGNRCEESEVFVSERGVKITGKMLGSDSSTVLRRTLHQILTVNSGVKMEDRDNMLETMTKFVLPKIEGPAAISIELQSSQSKFMLFSRDIPFYMNVFCDDSSYILMWSNDKNLEFRMRETYGNRFSVYRMNPVINSVCVLHTYYLKKKFSRWKHDLRDRLKILNALEGMISRRSRSDA